MLFSDIARYQLDDFGGDLQLRQMDGGHAVVAREKPGQLIGGNVAELDEMGAE